MYDDDEIMPLTFDHIRKRPGMFLGNNQTKGIITLISGLIKECTELCETDEFIFTISILGDNSFSIMIDGRKDLSPFLQLLIEPVTIKVYYFTMVLGAVTERLELQNDNIHFLFKNSKRRLTSSPVTIDEQTNIFITFQFDQKIIVDTAVDYYALNERLLLVALLNRRIEILSIDSRQKRSSQNYYHFPQGIFHVSDRIYKTFHSKPDFKVEYEECVSGNRYQVAVAYRPHWIPQPSIISFANDIQTTNGGSLVDGIVDGLILSCKKYFKTNHRSGIKIKRKNFFDELVIICSVSGGDFDYGGSFKEKLESEPVREQARDITFPIFFEYLENNRDIADRFLFRLTL